MTPLERILTQIILAAVVLGGAVWGGYSWGHDDAKKDCELAKAEAVKKATEEIEKDRDAGYELASEFETERRKYKGLYEKAEHQRKQSADLKIECPASGRLGDLVIPRSAIDGMFNRVPAVPAPGPAASQPDDAMRGGATAP